MPDAYDIDPTPVVPVPTPLPPPPGPGKIDQPSVLHEPAEEKCPSCSKPVPAAAVVCVNCGYDYRANMQRQVDLAAAKADAETDADEDDRPEFVTPGLGSAKVWGIIGGVVFVLAAVAAGYFVPEGQSAGAGAVAARVGLVVFQAVLHVPTGLLAVMAVAWYRDERLGRIDLAAARMFVAFALFLLVRHLQIPLPSIIGVGLQWLLGMLAYWAAVMLLFRKPPEVAGQIGAAHLSLFAGVHTLIAMQAALSAATAAAAATGPAAGG